MSNKIRYKKTRRFIRNLDNFNYNKLQGRKVKSKCDTELYVVRPVDKWQAPLLVHEGGHWYRLNKIPKKLRWMVPPEIEMTVMGDREMQTLSEFGITGIVMGEHERGIVFKLGTYHATHLRNPRPVWTASP